MNRHRLPRLSEKVEPKLPSRDPDHVLNEYEVAEIRGLKVGTLQSWRATMGQDLAWVKIGGCVRYRLRDVLAFIERGSV